MNKKHFLRRYRYRFISIIMFFCANSLSVSAYRNTDFEQNELNKKKAYVKLLATGIFVVAIGGSLFIHNYKNIEKKNDNNKYKEPLEPIEILPTKDKKNSKIVGGKSPKNDTENENNKLPKPTKDLPTNNEKASKTGSGKTKEKYTMLHSLKHSNNIVKLAYTPDGRYIASATSEFGKKVEELYLWDAETGSKIVSWKTHTDKIKVLEFSPDGKYLASGSDDKTVQIWDLQELLKGNVAHPYKTQSVDKSYIKCLSWAPTSTKFVTGYFGSENALSYSIDPGKNDVLKTYRPKVTHVLDIGSIRSLSWSSDGKYIAAADSIYEKIYIWNARTGECIVEKKYNESRSGFVSFSDDTKQIFFENEKFKIFNWDAGKSELTVCHEVSGYERGRVVPGERFLVSTKKEENKIVLWDLTTQKALPDVVKISHKCVTDLSLATTADGKTYMAICNEKTLETYDISGLLVST